MKKINFLLLITIGILLGISSCSDQLDFDPNGDLMNGKQVAEGATLSNDRAEAGVNGIFAQMTAYDDIYKDDWQSDFGYPALACWLEHAGDNVVSTTHGYNWFSRGLRYAGRAKNQIGRGHDFSWIHLYKYIKLANGIIQTGDLDNLNPGVGQAYAIRAWSYFFLAQTFQFTYIGNESSPCVPIVTEKTTEAELVNNPRKTVKEVYELILSDLEIAIKGLEGYQASAKNKIDLGVAYGIRSRVYMVMNEWQKAAEDAQKAIENTSASPFTIDDCSIPNFDDVQEAKNSMWGVIITGQDDVTKTGICNYTSMFTSLCFGAGGYTTMVGTYKMINTRLYNVIPETDVRKGWWAAPAQKYDKGKPVVDDEGNPVLVAKSPLLTKAYAADTTWLFDKLLHYSVVKFAPNKKSLTDKENATDFPLMRVEEMYYNLAESKAMAGDFAGGKTVLETFVQTYRDPEFKSKATNAVSLQDEIYNQKRIEFWGEGISWFDMMRLKKGINRVDVASGDTGGYPELTRFNITANDPILIYEIPLSEEQANKALDGKNNPSGTMPTDMIKK